jgi:tRNA pseudouridine32 synthase / 23S rRNA pseudouridine746 synthase
MMPRQSDAGDVIPARKGLGPSCVVCPPGAWLTLLAYLVERFPAVGAQEWARRLRCGDVLDAQGAPLSVDAAYQSHRKVFYFRAVADEPRIPFEETIVFQDAHIVVADKPHFLPVAPVGRYVQETLLVRLKARLGLDRLAPIHRIDRETAGLVVFCVQPEHRAAYHALMRDHAVAKVYEAIAPVHTALRFPWELENRLADAPHFMQMHVVEGAPNAQTRIECIESAGAWARYRLYPRTGQRHQLRVHMASLGIPIRHDGIYPTLRAERARDDADAYAEPLQLLAQSIAFIDPVTGAQRAFASARALALPAS